MIIILLLLLLLSLLLFYCTHNINTKEGLDSGTVATVGGAAIDTNNTMMAQNNSIGDVNYTLAKTPNFLNQHTASNIEIVKRQMKDFNDINKLVLQSQADLASISSEVNTLVTLEKILPKTTTGIAVLTPQVDALAPLVQKIKNVSSIISHNTSLLNNVGKDIQRRALDAAAPNTNVVPPPKGTGSSWPPPGGMASPPNLKLI
jgi:hypothetical protein